MNKKGKILALALTLALSATSIFTVGCKGKTTGSTETWMRAEANNFLQAAPKLIGKQAIPALLP